jgi:hypothetical protein
LGERVTEVAPPARIPVIVAPSPLVPAEGRGAAFDGLLATWQAWLAADDDARRAHRYTLFRHAGQAPDALFAFIHAAGRLAAAPDRSEVWLDAALALDARRMSLREQAWLRWRAALARGDEAAAAAWLGRYQKQLALASDPRAAELWQALRL